MDYSVQKKEYYHSFFERTARSRVSYRKRHSYYWDSITDYINYYVREDDSILEVGCGTGELLGRIGGREKMGIDFSQAMIEGAKAQFPSFRF